MQVEKAAYHTPLSTSTSRHDVAGDCLANGADLEVRHAVPGEVHRQQAVAARRSQDGVTGRTGEATDEVQAGTVGDTGQIDFVQTADEIEDLIDCTWLGVRAGREHKGVGTGATPQFVGTTATPKRVRPGTPVEEIRFVLAIKPAI